MSQANHTPPTLPFIALNQVLSEINPLVLDALRKYPAPRMPLQSLRATVPGASKETVDRSLLYLANLGRLELIAAPMLEVSHEAFESALIDVRRGTAYIAAAYVPQKR
mgnify:CR=1 FL=1